MMNTYMKAKRHQKYGLVSFIHEEYMKAKKNVGLHLEFMKSTWSQKGTKNMDLVSFIHEEYMKGKNVG